MKGAREHGAMGSYQGYLRSIYKRYPIAPLKALYRFLYMVFFGTREITYDRWWLSPIIGECLHLS